MLFICQLLRLQVLISCNQHNICVHKIKNIKIDIKSGHFLDQFVTVKSGKYFEYNHDWLLLLLQICTTDNDTVHFQTCLMKIIMSSQRFSNALFFLRRFFNHYFIREGFINLRSVSIFEKHCTKLYCLPLFSYINK